MQVRERAHEPRSPSTGRSRFAPASLARLRAALERALDDPPSGRKREQILFLLLGAIGPSPAVLHRLWELAIEQPTAVDERRFYADGDVIRALARLPPDPVLDARLVERARAALVMRLLDAAASSAARSGRPRAIALSSLVWFREIDCSDPRIADALETSEPEATALLLGRMDLRDELHRGTLPAEAMNRARLRVLKEGSAKDALAVLDDVFRSPPPGFTDLLDRALSRGEVHAEAVHVARHICGIPSEAELYWQDDMDEKEADEADC